MQAWHLLSWLKGAIITLFEHHFVTHSTSKLIGECLLALLWLSTACQWGMTRCIVIVNSMPKLIVVVENHCKCHLFLLFMICAHFPLHHSHSTIFQSKWVVTGLPSTSWSMINIIDSFQSFEGKIKSNNWKAVIIQWIWNDENIGCSAFDPFNWLLLQLPDISHSLSNKLFATSL